MVSLKYAREQQEAALRRARFEEARRIGSAMGVQRARAYAAQKTVQAMRVRNDMRKQWECEVQQQAALIDRVLYDGQSRLGEGMRGAAGLTAAHQQHASDELNAWVAEHTLERERHRIAMATERVTRALQEEPHRGIVERKRATRGVEDRRSKARISRPLPRPPSFASHSSPLVGALSYTAIERTSPPAPATNTTLATEDGDNAQPAAARGDAAAARFGEERRRELASERKLLWQSQRGAAERAAAYLLKRKEEAKEAREAAQRRAENVAALEQRISAGPQEDTSRSGKELETRRAAALRAQEEAEFERMFLRGPLSSTDDSTTAENEEDGEADARFFPLSSVSCLLPGDTEVAVQLHPRPFHVHITPDEAEETAASEAGSEAPSAASAAPQPTFMSPGVMPDGRTPSPTHTPRSLEHSAGLEAPLPASPLPPPPPPSTISLSPPAATATKAAVAEPAYTLDDPQGLALHHERFLRNLKVLQDKLTKASSAVAEDSGTIDASTLHGNVSLSPMSSVPSPAHRPSKEAREERGTDEEEEETGTSSTGTSANSGSSNDSSSISTGPSLSSTHSRSYPTMTAEQLKAALLRLKLRMRSV
ncbi:hypothetical protein TraAM80_01534 [Trypanosoma rangeli]|uniref:Uncharacterized protein n=1 Tax=Trypanosoma rangeli TaxID=5698 RepID=A0A422NYG5_TRYRA|nr:uncharacterized protein TraAM80_01534 [Trypanosoma rangeli]RNF10488.1 hypothetical protein TraAM80_01534 [Trypanosoma rangeli]|eukprot:RNF10488.1 hypothetical protein TraAM80_01534 [Trypanosoma rangeli]